MCLKIFFRIGPTYFDNSVQLVVASIVTQVGITAGCNILRFLAITDLDYSLVTLEIQNQLHNTKTAQ